MERTLKYKDWEIKEGDFIEGTIEGVEVQGVLGVNKREHSSKFYFYQNKKNGARFITQYSYRYRYSWSFNCINNKLSSDVEITKVKDGKILRSSTKKYSSIEFSKREHLGMIQWSKQEGMRYYSTKYGQFPDLVTKTTYLFKTKRHPDCCGSTLFYDFDRSGSISYGRYKDLTSKDYKQIISRLEDSQSAKIVHLSNKQVSSIKFIEKLGFEKQFQYKNNNSGNTILVYHFNPKKK